MKKKTPVILAVDDQIPNRLMMRGILEREGFIVTEAADGKEARRAAAERRPDLILMDIRMPGEDGFEACSRLKEEPRTAEIPLIFISAMDDVSEKVKGFELGAVDYVTKPFEPAEVLARVRLHIRMARSRQDLIENQTERLKRLSEAQRAILPRPEDYPEARFAVAYQPLMEAGGDFYEVLSLGDRISGYICADVSGHDVGSSLATSALKVLLHQNSGPLYPPEETMKIVNSVLLNTLGEDIYLTVIYAHLNRKLNKMRIVNAGHPPVIHQKAGGILKLVQGRGDLIGMFETVHLGISEVSVEPGDRFFLYSDGLIERQKSPRMGRPEGIERLVALLSSHCKEPLNDQIHRTMKELHLDKGEAEDDLLLMGVEV